MLATIHPPHDLATRIVLLLGGVFLSGVATGAYIGAGLGPGPRDGLMTGWARRGHRIWAVRTTIEISVLVIGFALGGTVGVGTLIYAASIGPLAHFFIPLLAIRTPPPDTSVTPTAVRSAGAAETPDPASDRTSTRPPTAARRS
jgi:uncharacterized membrane protein YczE